MKEKMGKAGYEQGHMSPHVEDYQKPMSAYSQKDMNKTTEYVERQNRQQHEYAKDLERKSYKGRYS